MFKLFKRKDKIEPEGKKLQASSRQKKRLSIIIGGVIFVILTAVGLVGTAFYRENKPLRETVIRVNDVSFNMDYYVNLFKLMAGGQSLDSLSTLADTIAQTIEEAEEIRQGAAKLDITITEDELNAELAKYTPPAGSEEAYQKTTKMKEYRDWVRAQMLFGKVRDEYFDTKVPQSAEQRQVLSMFLESESVANSIRDRIDKGESFTALAADYSPEQVIKDSKGDLGWVPKGVLPIKIGSDVLDEQVFQAETGMLSQPVSDQDYTKYLGYWIVKIIEERQEGDTKQAHIRAILLGSEEEAKQVKVRIEAGEDFATLAEQLSQDEYSKTSGGDMGFLRQGEVNPIFANFLFNQDQQTLSDPIRDETVVTKGGYWLFKVSERDVDRKIEGDNRLYLSGDLTDKYFTSFKDSCIIENLLDDAKKQWAMARVLKEMGY